MTKARPASEALAVWEAVRESIPAGRRAKAAEAVLRALESGGRGQEDLAALADADGDMAAALRAMFGAPAGEGDDKMFRDVGFSASAAQFPLSERALLWKRRYNGVPDTVPKVPPGWHYASNAVMRDWIEKLAEIDCPVTARSGDRLPSPSKLGLAPANNA